MKNDRRIRVRVDEGPEDARIVQEVRRISALVRDATRGLPADMEPAHHALYFERLADAVDGDDGER